MKTGRLLIIDDEPEIGQFIKTVSERCNFESIVTSDAETFKTRLMELEPDVIILDLAMPGVDGIELLRHLSDVGCRAKLLIISGFDGRVCDAAQRLGDAKGLNMSGRMTKPLRVAELRATLESLGEDL